MKLPSINNRELLPIRLIPYAAGFKPGPQSLVQLLTHDQGLAFPLFRPEDELFAYYLADDGVPVKMLPMEWKTLSEDMSILEKKFRVEETFEDAKYREWRLEAIKLLPSGVFVWRDEFESLFKASFVRNGRKYTKNSQGSTGELNFNPYIDPQYLSFVWEGFDSLRFKQPEVDAQPIHICLTAKMRSKIKIGFADFIRLFRITDLKNWQSGLRIDENSVWNVATLDGCFSTEEFATLNEHPEKNFNKPVLTFPCTLDQLDYFIEDQGFLGYIHPSDMDKFVQNEIKKMKRANMKNDLKDNPKAIDSLLKLVIAMAIKGYGFDPDQNRSKTPAELMSDVEQVGLSIDLDTVRKWLKLGAELLPPDWNKDN